MNENSDKRLFLRRVHIDNYKCMSNFDLSFGDITLLLGKNGCGKSAVFEALDNLHRFVCREGKLSELFPASSLTRWNDSGKQSFELEAGDAAGDSECEEIFRYRLVVEHSMPARNVSFVKEETLTVNGKPLLSVVGGGVQLYKKDGAEEGAKFFVDGDISALLHVSSRHDDARLTRFREWMRGILFLSLNVLAMKGGADSDDEYLESDGGNFVSRYRGMLMENPPLIATAEEKLRDVLPGFLLLRMPKIGGDAYRELEARFALPDGGEDEYRFSELSAGQRALIALYMIIFGGGKERLLLLDEPDNFVMLPEIQPLLAELEDEAGRDLPQTALISHHPEAMNFIASKDSVWMEREAQSFARIKEFKNDTELSVSELFAHGVAP